MRWVLRCGAHGPQKAPEPRVEAVGIESALRPPMSRSSTARVRFETEDTVIDRSRRFYLERIPTVRTKPPDDIRNQIFDDDDTELDMPAQAQLC